ncbi:MAG: CoB--CoM heterodisulfide reductase iron-sulfur subunit A family protein [Deltaproteobacteria bacterium]|jgi:heterodisulfide reductase subunit A|nr:CoB--CoM heterodisulfide reductase iron-sulfur subunit A family protein [Deltaproteobacteria bacterium]
MSKDNDKNKDDEATDINENTDANDTVEKIGVYICHCGGNISDHVDVEKVAESVKNIPGVTKVHTNSFMCSDPGQELIEKDIKSGSINRVVVASCAPSLHESTFRGAIKRADMNPFLYDHANIREQVSWVHDGEPATAKASILVKSSIEKARGLKALDVLKVDAKKHVLIVGGGIAGMRSGLDLAKQGFEVAILEKSPFLGGQASKLSRLAPSYEYAKDLIVELYTQLSKQNKVTFYTCAEMSSFKGYIGNFDVTLTREPSDAVKSKSKGEFVENRGIFIDNIPKETEEIAITIGAVVMATGFKTYEPAEDEFGFNKLEPVTTLEQFIQDYKKAETKKGILYLNNKKIKRIAFIHCVGSRQIPGIHEPDKNGNLNEYCSRTCCSSTLQAAERIKTTCPNTDVFDFYRDIRTYGRFQEDIYDSASEKGVMFFRFEPDAQPEVTENKNGKFPISIKTKDVLTFNEEIEVDVDLVVLVTGIIPNDISSMINMMKLPVGTDKFLQEVHPKLRPVEVANTGILLAGTCQAPMDITESCAAAQAASVKATALLYKGFVELDPFVAQVDTELCKGHGECLKVCPVDNTIEIDKVAKVNPALCTGCGICTAVCPENAIDVMGWSLKQYEKMVDAILAA